MIIGISGKKQHGKDTVAKIIQYLLIKESLKQRGSVPINKDDSFNFSIIDRWHPKERLAYSGFEIKQFAGKLKQIVSLLIGCSIEQLEDNNFKEKELGPEWKLPHEMYENYLLIFHEEQWLDFVKNYPPDKNFLELSEIVWFAEKVLGLSMMLTPRKLLQLIGTEGGRKLIHPNIWINATMVDYKPFYDGSDETIANLKKAVKWAKEENNCILDEIKLTKIIPEQFPNWIITDVRFINEVEAIHKRDGIVIRINNPSVISLDTHDSETSLDDFPGFDYVITNDGSIEDLINMVSEVLKQSKII